MKIKCLSYGGIMGLAMVALVPPAFGQPEQLHEKQAQPQIERQQRDQKQRADQTGPDKEVEETELTASPPMSGEQERLFRQQQIQQEQIRRQEIEDRAQRDMLQTPGVMR